MKISIDEDFSFTRVFLSFFILAELLIHVKVERESGIEFSAVPPRDQNETFHPTKTKIPRREESRCTDSTKEFAAEGVSPREGVNDEKRGREKMRPGHVTRQVVGGIVDAVESVRGIEIFFSFFFFLFHQISPYPESIESVSPALRSQGPVQRGGDSFRKIGPRVEREGERKREREERTGRKFL